MKTSVNVILDGIVENPSWNWSEVNRHLFFNNGILTEQNPLDLNPLLERQFPVAKVITPTKIFFNNGLGSLGEQGLPGTEFIEYPINFFHRNFLIANDILDSFIIPRNIEILQSVTHYAKVNIAPQFDVEFDIKVNDIKIGNIAFTSGLKTGVVSLTLDVGLTPGDVIYITTINNIDNILRGLSVTLIGCVRAIECFNLNDPITLLTASTIGTTTSDAVNLEQFLIIPSEQIIGTSIISTDIEVEKNINGNVTTLSDIPTVDLFNLINGTVNSVSNTPTTQLINEVQMNGDNITATSDSIITIDEIILQSITLGGLTTQFESMVLDPLNSDLMYIAAGNVNQGIHKYDLNTDTFTGTLNYGVLDEPFGLVVDINDKLWVLVNSGGNWAVRRIDIPTEVVEKDTGFIGHGSGPRYLSEGGNGWIWVIGFNYTTVYGFDPNAPGNGIDRTFTISSPTGTTQENGFLADSNGNVWVSHQTNSVSFYNFTTMTITQVLTGASNAIVCFVEQGSFVYGFSRDVNAGIYIFNKNTGAFINVSTNTFTLSHHSAYTIIDNNGFAWVGGSKLNLTTFIEELNLSIAQPINTSGAINIFQHPVTDKIYIKGTAANEITVVGAP